MDAADMRSPAASAPARRGRQEPMDHGPVIPAGRDPVTPTAMDLSRASATKRQATMRRRPSSTGRLITDQGSITVRAGVGEDGGGGEGLFCSGVILRRRTPVALCYRCTPSAADNPPSTGSTAPVTYDAPGDIRNATTAAISSGVAKRRAGIWPSMVSRNLA